MENNLLVGHHFHLFSELKHLLLHATWSGMLLAGLWFLKLGSLFVFQLIQLITFGFVIFRGHSRRDLPVSALLIRIGAGIWLGVMAVLCFGYAYTRHKHDLAHKEGSDREMFWIFNPWAGKGLRTVEMFSLWVAVLSVLRITLFMIKLMAELSRRFIFHLAAQ